MSDLSPVEREALEAFIKAIPGIRELPAYGEVVRTSASLAGDVRRGWLAARDYYSAAAPSEEEVERLRDALRMSDAAIADAERALADLHGPDKGGHNTLRRLNAAAFVGERYGSALVADWKMMRAALAAARLADSAVKSADDLPDDLRRVLEDPGIVIRQDAARRLSARTAHGGDSRIAAPPTTSASRQRPCASSAPAA